MFTLLFLPVVLALLLLLAWAYLDAPIRAYLADLDRENSPPVLPFRGQDR